MADKETPKWRDVYSVLEPEDHALLDTNAAVHEFRGGMSKEESEERAHKDYLRNHALDSAAFHYLGMRSAIAGKNQAAAKKHGESYALAMNHLGLNPNDVIPQEVLDRIKDSDKGPYSFKAHKADLFFEPQAEIPGIKEEPKDKTIELLERLKNLRIKATNNT